MRKSHLPRAFVAGCASLVLALGVAGSVHAQTSSVIFVAPMSIGSTGAQVTALQQVLVTLGFLTVEPTGYFGPLTSGAVAKFQAAHGLEAVGSVGPLTRAALNNVSGGTGLAPSAAAAQPVSPVVPAAVVSSADAVVVTRALAIGASGTDVTQLQQFLKKQGYLAVDATGYFGPITSAAVSAFQKANGLEAVGAVGPQTRALLAKASASVTPAAGAASRTVTTNSAANSSPDAAAKKNNASPTAASRTSASVTTSAQATKPVGGGGGAAQPVPVSTASEPAPDLQPSNLTTYLNNKKVTLFGYPWITQSGNDGQAGASAGIATDAQGTLYISVKPGERASFDPVRKMRSEIAGYTRPFVKNEVAHSKFDLYIEPYTNASGLDWNSPVQIHQADSRFADAVPVSASPMFATALFEDGTGKMKLVVQGETSKGVPAPNEYPVLRILGTKTGITKGEWHTLEYVVIDGHGGPGRISVWLDGVAITNRSDINTGYEYVDLLASTLYAGKAQQNGSYVKMGIYAGLFSGNNPPPASVNVGYRYRNVSLVYLAAQIPSPTQNARFSWTPTVTGTTGAVSWNFAGTLPDGLSFSRSTGAITGTPTTQNPIVGVLSVTDANGTTATLPQTTPVNASQGASAPESVPPTTATPTPTPAPGAGDITSGLVAYYKFSEGSGKTVADSSGSGNTATFTRGAEAGAWSAGKFGGGLLVGSTTPNAPLLNAPNSASLSSIDAKQTIAFWVKGNNGPVSPSARFISKRASTGWTIGEMGNFKDLYMRIDTAAGTNQTVGIMRNVLDSTWHHVAWVLNEGTAQLYKDGALVSTVSYNGTSLANTASLTMMFADGQLGSMDEVRLYSRALSAADISQLYSNTFAKASVQSPLAAAAASAGEAVSGFVRMISGFFLSLLDF